MAAPEAPTPAPVDELPPLATQMAPPPILPPSEIDQAKPTSRRQVDPKLLLLVLLVVGVAAAAYWLFLKPSSSSDETFVPPVHHKAPAAATHRVSALPASFAGYALAPATTAAGKAWHVAATPFAKAGYRTVVGGIYTDAGSPEFGYVAAASPRAGARTGSLSVAAFAASVKQNNPKATFVEKPTAAGPLGGTAVCGSATGMPLGYCAWRDAHTAGAVFGVAKDLPKLLLQVRAAVEH